MGIESVQHSRLYRKDRKKSRQRERGIESSNYSVCLKNYMPAQSPVMSNSLQPFGLQPTRLLCPWDFFRQEYWSGLPFLPPRESSWLRDQTHVSCVFRTGRWVLYHCATWEAHYKGLVPSFLIFISLGLWFPFNKRPFSSIYTSKAEAPSKRDNFSFSHLLTGPLSALTVPDP